MPLPFAKSLRISPTEKQTGALLEVSGVSYRVGALEILRDVSFCLNRGEVVGLAGSSGAGKTTLLRIFTGQITPETGKIYYQGVAQKWPFPAHNFPIGAIHHQPELVDSLDITSNVFLGHELCWPIPFLEVPNRGRMEVETRRILNELDLYLDNLRMPVGYLSNEQRHLIAIAKTMIRPLELVLVDDPSIFLNYPYQQKLLALIRSWQNAGASVIFASDNLDHLFAVADRIIVLQQGRLVADTPTDQTSRENIVGAMIDAADRKQRTPTIWALDSYFQARKQAEILRHNQMLLEQNLAAQDVLNRRLVDQLAEQVKALDAANLALQNAQRRLLTERELERKRLARELHDEMIQALLGLSYQLEGIRDKAVKKQPIGDDLNDVREGIRELVDSLRRVCRDLRPPTIDSLGLGAALQSYTQEWSARTGIRVELVLEAQVGRLPESIELSIFRIVQESLSNVWKHSSADCVRITLCHPSPRKLLMTIADNGIGIPDEFDLVEVSRSGHYGLLGISERVTLMGGKLNLRNQIDGGLIIEVEIPHPKVSG
ncbi:MAG: ATP-binding cassette domain-containing protein [Chloroflexi bacterium]|nr:ATP-binding cassette domain-containing protein [Chloroflexota bacterium]